MKYHSLTRSAWVLTTLPQLANLLDKLRALLYYRNDLQLLRLFVFLALFDLFLVQKFGLLSVQETERRPAMLQVQ